jgi:hypothetical protein
LQCGATTPALISEPNARPTAKLHTVEAKIILQSCVYRRYQCNSPTTSVKLQSVDLLPPRFAMRTFKSSSSPISDLLHTCPAFWDALDLQTLACFASCSSNFRTRCHATLGHDSLALLQPTVEAAKKGQLHEQHQQGAVWLARHLQRERAATTAAAVAQQLTSLPSVPLSWAVQLVAAGVRISYSQLLDAASRSLAGVEVWVQAQQ